MGIGDWGLGIGDWGGEVARFHHTDLDAEASHLGAEGLRKTLDGELRGGIEALIRQAHHATDGAEVDNLPLACFAHIGKHRLAEVHATHEIGAHLQVYLLLCGQLQGTSDAHTGVVHQHVHPTLLLDDFRHHSGYLRAVANIALAVMDGGMLHLAAAEAVDDMPFLGQEFGRSLPEARRGAGDDDDLLHVFLRFEVQKYKKKDKSIGQK